MSLIRRNCPRTFPSTHLGLALILMLGYHSSDTARAQAPRSKTVELEKAAPEAKRDDPKARAIFDEVSKAYKSLSSYTDQGQFVVAMTAAGKSDKQVVPLKVTLVRPNKFEIDTNVVKLTSDGKTLTTSVIPLKRYTAVPAPEKVDIETFREGPIGAALFGGPSGVPMFVLLNLLTAPDPASAIAQIGGTLQLVAGSGPKSDAAKAGASALLIELGKGRAGVLLTIDPATKLLSSIDLKIAPETLNAQNVSIEKLGWSSGAVSTEVAKDRSFAFDVPKGFTKVDTLLEKQGEARAKNSKLGKPAPDFTLTLLDGPGKTKTVTKTELAGKVVVIDFWATWCKPCLMELPEIQKLVESYANTKKELVVVALSQDDEPSDVTQLRTRRKDTRRQEDQSDSQPGGTDRTGSEQVGRDGLRAGGLSHACHSRRQGDGSIGSCRLQSRSRRAAQQDPRQGNRRLARRQVAGKPQRTRGGRLEKIRPIQAVTANAGGASENIDSCRTWKKGRENKSRPLFLAAELLDITNGDQAGAQLFVEVGLATNTDSLREQRIDVKARGDIEVCDRRAVIGDQNVELVAVERLRRRLHIAPCTESPRMRPGGIRYSALFRRDFRIAAMTLGQDLFNRSRSLRGLLVSRDTRQAHGPFPRRRDRRSHYLRATHTSSES